jgi:hypothetical protein
MLENGKEDKIFSPFKPTLQIKEAFWHLQSELTKASVLAKLDFKRLISLETDGSGFAIAGFILQPLASPTATEDE